MRVREIMNSKVKQVNPNKTIKKAAEIMREKKIGSLLVVKSSFIHGIVTERDILNIVADKGDFETPVDEIMSEDVVTVEPGISLEDAAEVMVEYNIKRVPVVEDDKLVGIITASDLIAYEDKLVEKLSEVFLNPILSQKSKSGSMAS